MSKNPQTGKIILVDHTEVDSDGRGAFLKIYALGGETFRIAEKRSSLWDYFRNARYGEPILAIFETYMNIEYIAGAQLITDDLLKQAVTKLGEKIADAQTEERIRSQSLAYAKDLCVAGIEGMACLYTRAEMNYRFVKGQKQEE